MSTLATQKQQQQQNVTPQKNSQWQGFVIGGLAACGAVTFTNPWEVI